MTTASTTASSPDLPSIDTGEVLRDTQTGQLLEVTSIDRTRNCRGRPLKLVHYEVLEDPHGWKGSAFTLAEYDDQRRTRTAVHSLYLDRCEKAADNLVPLTDAEVATLKTRRQATHRTDDQTALDAYRP